MVLAVRDVAKHDARMGGFNFRRCPLWKDGRRQGRRSCARLVYIVHKGIFNQTFEEPYARNSSQRKPYYRCREQISRKVKHALVHTVTKKVTVVNYVSSRLLFAASSASRGSPRAGGLFASGTHASTPRSSPDDEVLIAGLPFSAVPAGTYVVPIPFHSPPSFLFSPTTIQPRQ